MNIITFDTLPSTNDYLLDLSKKGANSWTVIHAYNQIKGKGYAGNVWQTNPNENLTFSLLIKSDLDYKDLIVLNQWVAGCIYKVLSSIHGKWFIKWPNDIILNDKKVCGVLIENYKSNKTMHTIIGIGININQTDFNHLPKASSLQKETDIQYDILAILADLIDGFKNEFNLIENKSFTLISDFYNKYLYKKNQLVNFRIEEKICEGKILYVASNGNLVVDFKGKEYEFMHKQIELIF